ncbi:MAG: hypothetical protein ACI9E1_000510 [Cryomorphaceae bacterium]|jgi:hypothetical protein
MNFSISNLTFSPSVALFIIGIVALVIIGALCLTAWKRASRPYRTGMLEGLRFLIALIIVLMLWKPEWRTITYPEDKPEIAILWDGSESMTTKDAVLPKWMNKNSPVSSRADFIKQALDAEFWKKLEDGGKVRVFTQDFSAFSADISPEEKSKLGSDLNTPLNNLLEEHDNLKAVILLSDGDHNLNRKDGNPNSPTRAAQQLLINKTPLYSVPVGADKSLPDLELINLSAPDFGIVGEYVQIPFSIKSSMEKDIRTTITIKDDIGGSPKTKTVTIPSNKTYRGSMLWQLKQEGSTKLKLSFPVSQGEFIASNNNQEFIIGAKKESIKVLVIESRPRWEYRFIRNALSRDPGVDVDCLLLHPKHGKGDGPDYIQNFPDKLEVLQKYDVVFLGDIGIGKDQLTLEQANLLAGLVKEQASGIVFIPGPLGNQLTLKDSDLGPIIPIIFDETKPEGLSDEVPSPLNLTTPGKSSLLTLLGENEAENPKIWRNLPGFYWCAAVKKTKAGATVLATHANRKNSYGSIPMLVTKQAGSGKALFLGHDSAWRWRRGVEDLYHFRFWKNVARWMSYQRNMAAGERLRLYRTPDRPKPGDLVSLSVNAFDANGVPLREGNVEVEIIAPDKTIKTLILDRSEGNWGAFTGAFDVDQIGEWKVTAGIEGDKTAKTVSTSIIAQGQQIEKVGKPVNTELLKEMSRITKGQLMTPDQLNQISNLIDALPAKSPLESRYPIWAHIALLILLIILLACFWIGRKLNGTF